MTRFVLACAAIWASHVAAFTIQTMKHEIQPITKLTFNQVISMHRGDGVSAVWLYYEDSKVDKDFLETYDKLAIEAKGMVKITSVNCSVEKALAKDLGAVKGDKPQIMVYAPPHQPAYAYSGTMTKDKLKSHLVKRIPGMYVTTWKDRATYDKWVLADPEKPKVVLFSEKPGDSAPPTLIKALSTNSVFLRSMKFGFAPAGSPAYEAESGARTRRDSKKLPAWLIIRGSGPTKKETKREYYKGADVTNFSEVHAWLNTYSESGMGDTLKTGGAGDHGKSSSASGAESERLPQIDVKTQKNLCTGQKNMCGIYLTSGYIGDPATDMVLGFDDKFGDSGDRGVKYSWMWADIEQQKSLKEILQAEADRAAEKAGEDQTPISYPTMIFVKPPKKDREKKFLTYTMLPIGEKVSESTVASTIEKIAAGTTYTRGDVPTWKPATPKPVAAKEEL